MEPLVALVLGDISHTEICNRLIRRNSHLREYALDRMDSRFRTRCLVLFYVQLTNISDLIINNGPNMIRTT